MNRLHDPNRIIHYRLEGKHAQALCRCKMPPRIRPRLLPRLIGASIPLPFPVGHTCDECWKRAQTILQPHSPLMKVKPPPTPPPKTGDVVELP
jgi:hypothetical protein